VKANFPISSFSCSVSSSSSKTSSARTGTTTRTIFYVSSFFILNSAFAETTNSIAVSSLDPALSAPDVGTSLLRVMGALALVLGVFLAGVWLFRNWQRLAVRRGRAPKLNVLEIRSLGGRQSIYVVGYEQERFLLASSPAGVNFLTHLPSADNEEAGATEAKPQMPFSQALAQVLKGK
jgi:flagellar biogenesis protein FliO